MKLLVVPSGLDQAHLVLFVVSDPPHTHPRCSPPHACRFFPHYTAFILLSPFPAVLVSFHEHRPPGGDSRTDRSIRSGVGASTHQRQLAFACISSPRGPAVIRHSLHSRCKISIPLLGRGLRVRPRRTSCTSLPDTQRGIRAILGRMYPEMRTMAAGAWLPAITHTVCPGSTNRESGIGNNGQYCGRGPCTCAVPAPRASELDRATVGPLSVHLFTAN